MRKKRVLHVITSTGVGGAENMLYKYLSYSDKEVIDHSVISLKDLDHFGGKIKDLDIPIHGLSKPIYTLSGIKEFYKTSKEFNPDILQSWLYHSDLACLILNLFLKIKLCWNIRSYKVYKFQKITGALVRFLAIFSKVPDVIIINSLASKDYHHRILYRPKRWEHVPNGFDLSFNKDKPDLVIDIRSELNIPPESLIIGMIARYSKDKDHKTFLKACSLINKELPNVHFVMIGNQIDRFNLKLVNISDQLKISNQVHMLGTRNDIPQVMPNFDIVCSSSIDEAFPNTIGEAMAASVPCVVTDVGDCALLVGDTGRVVESKSPVSLSKECLNLLRMPNHERLNLGKEARNRIAKHFSIKNITKKYDEIYLGL